MAAIVASVLELPLQRTAVDEGASFGAALLGGVAAGVFADVHEADAACVRPREVVEPVADWIEPYREARDRFAGLYPALRPHRNEEMGRMAPPILQLDQMRARKSSPRSSKSR